jgi:hypothetical protein
MQYVQKFKRDSTCSLTGTNHSQGWSDATKRPRAFILLSFSQFLLTACATAPEANTKQGNDLYSGRNAIWTLKVSAVYLSPNQIPGQYTPLPSQPFQFKVPYYIIYADD